MKTDPLGEYLAVTLQPTSSKKRPAYEAAQEARRMVVAEVVEALRDWDTGWNVHPAVFIEREFGAA